MSKKTILILLVIIVLLAVLVVAFYLFSLSQPEYIPPVALEPEQQITNFEECVAAGNPVMESYPRQCQANGQVFTEEIGNELDKTNLIRVDFPRPDQIIASPLTIIGQARGYWFFEADFPVKLYDANDNLIASGIAFAQTDWMTEDFVPFTAELKFTLPTTAQGTLVLEKANPSDLPANADQLNIPVNFQLSSQPIIEPGLIIEPGSAMPDSVEETPEGQIEINFEQGEEAEIILAANPTTGYQWIVNFDDSLLELTDQDYQPASDLLGAGGQQTFIFKALEKGEADVSFSYARPWQLSQPIKQKSYQIIVK